MARSKVDSKDFLSFMNDEENFMPSSFSRPSKVPNLSQSEVKLEPKLSLGAGSAKRRPESKLSQSEVKVESAGRVELSIEKKVEPQPEPLLESNLRQSEVKVEPNSSVLALVGLQREILNFLFHDCQTHGSRITNPISISNVALSTNTTVSSARKALQRLEHKGFLFRSSYKDGRGGFTTYELPINTYSELIQLQSRDKLKTNLSQTEANVKPQPEPQPEPKLLNSSSKDLKIENTNTEDGDLFVIPDNLKSLGVGQRNLRNILQATGLSLDEVQSSLDHFSFDVQSGIIKKNHLNLLMGILRKKNVYISSGFTQQIEQELNEHILRINQYHERQKQLNEVRLQEKFESYLESNPEFLAEVKKTTNVGFSLSDEMLKKMAFSRWSQQEVEID